MCTSHMSCREYAIVIDNHPCDIDVPLKSRPRPGLDRLSRRNLTVFPRKVLVHRLCIACVLMFHLGCG